MPDQTPCEILAELETAKRALLTGKAVKLTRFRAATGEERETHRVAADMKALDAEIRRYRDLCDRSKGGTGRFAIRAG